MFNKLRERKQKKIDEWFDYVRKSKEDFLAKCSLDFKDEIEHCDVFFNLNIDEICDYLHYAVFSELHILLQEKDFSDNEVIYADVKQNALILLTMQSIDFKSLFKDKKRPSVEVDLLNTVIAKKN